MAEQNEVLNQEQQQGVVPQEQQQGTENVLAPAASDENTDNGEPQVDDAITSRLRAIGHLLTEEERAEIIAAGNKRNGTQKQQQPTENSAATEKKDDKKPVQADQKQAESAKPSVFGFGKKKTDDKGAQIVIESPDHILPVIQKEFGMADLKDIKDLPKFFESTRDWRNKAQQFEKVNKEHTQVLQEIESLPVEFHEAFRALSEGKDYRAPFTQSAPKFDYKLDADKQDVKSLVDHYFPDKFTKEDFEESEKSPQLEMAISLSKDKYTLEKQKVEAQRAEKAAAGKKQLDAYKASLAGSVSDLTQAFPEMDADAIKEVQSVFEGGQRSVLSYFFNDDGTVKPTAMRQFALAVHGEAEIQRMMELGAHIGETRANEEILSRGADRPDPRRSSGQQDMVSDEVKKKIAGFERLGKISGGRTY